MGKSNLLQGIEGFTDRVPLTSRFSSVQARGTFVKGTLLFISLGVWQYISLSYPAHIFPGLVEIGMATQQVIVNPDIGTFSGHLWDTFRRLFIGFSIAVVFGGILGTMMGLRRDVETFFRPWIVLGLSVPTIAVAFILIISLGITEWVPLLTIIIVSLPFVMLNMWEGTQDIDLKVIEMANSFEASRYQKVRHILLPQIMQYLFPSLFWGFIVAWKVLFIAEVFGAGSGIGYMVSYWFPQQRVDLMIAWVLIPMLLIILIQKGIRYGEHHVMDWR